MSIPASRLNMNRNERQSSSSANNNTDAVQFGDWVADFGDLSSHASKMFNCAIDTTDSNNNKQSNQAERFGNTISPTMSSTDVESVDNPVIKANEIFSSPTPRMISNNRTTHHQVVHDPRYIARRDVQCAETSNISSASNSLPNMDDTPDLERADDINMSAVSAVSVAPVSTLPMAPPPTLTLETKKTWDDLYEQNNTPDPDRTNDTIHTKNTKLGEELTPEGRRKRKMMIAMGVIVLAAILLTVGVVLLEQNHLSNKNSNNSSAEEAQGGADEAVDWGGEFDNVLDTYSPTSTSSSYFPTSSPAKTIVVSDPTEEQDDDPEVDSTPVSSENEPDNTSPSYNNQADDMTASSPSSSSSSSGNDDNSQDSGIMAWPSSGNEPILIPIDDEEEENVVQDSSSWIKEEDVAAEQDAEAVAAEDSETDTSEQEQVNPIPSSNTNNEVIPSPSIIVSPPAEEQISSPTIPAPPAATPEAEPVQSSGSSTTENDNWPTYSPTYITPKPTPRPVTGQPTTANPTPNPVPLPTTANPTTANPTPRPTPRVTPSPTSGLDAVASGKTQELTFMDGFAQSSESRLTIRLKTDGHGEETSWFLYRLDLDTNQLASSPVASVAEGTYADFEQDQINLMLEPGKYRFTLKDKYGDGFCCSNGSDGWYKLYVDNKEIVRGAYYRFEKSHDILVGFRPELTMTSRDAAW